MAAVQFISVITTTVRPQSVDETAPSTSNLPPHLRVLIVIIFAIISLLIPLTLACQLRVSIENGRGDFKCFYDAGKIVRSGNGSRLYDPATQSEIDYIHAPYEALLFGALAALPFDRAVWLWWVLNLALAYASVYLLLALVPKVAARVEFALLSLGIFLPILIAEIFGQDTILILFLFTICVRSLASGHFWVAGSALAMSMCKPNLALPLIVMVALTSPRAWSIIAGFVGTCVLLLIVSIATVGLSAVLAYPRAVLNFGGSRGDSHVQEMANVRGLVHWIFQPHLSRTTLFLLVAGISALVIAVSVWSSEMRHARPDEEKELLRFALFVIATLLVGYHDYSYDLALLLLPLFLIWNWSGKARRDTLPRKLLKYSVPVLICLSLLILVTPQIYTCAVVLLFVLICWELRTGRQDLIDL